MRWRNALRFRESILLTFHSDTGSPFAVRVTTRKLVSVFVLTASTGGLLFLGTLLFFREMQATRELESRVMQLEIEARLQQDIAKLPVDLKSPAPRVNPSQVPQNIPRTITNEPEREAPKKPERKVERKNEAAVGIVPPPPKPEWVRPRLKSLSTQCKLPFCEVKVSLTREKSGAKVKGSAVIVLESKTKATGRTQYHVSPGNRVRSEFDKSEAVKISGKRFSFSYLFPFATRFAVNPDSEPIRATVYLMDHQGKFVAEKSQPVSILAPPDPKPEPAPVAGKPAEPAAEE